MSPEQVADLKRRVAKINVLVSRVLMPQYVESVKELDSYINSLTQDAQPVATFQNRVAPWMQACFGAEISSDKVERNHRFLEEALELVQSTGCTQVEAYQLVDYVYGRDVGDPPQEVGGVMVTLAALCLAHDMDMHDAGEVELARIWTKVEQIRAKQAAKPRNNPLPAQPVQAELTDEEWIELAIRDVAELPDRNSPADWPEAMLVTADELRNILTDRAKRSKQ